MKYLNIHVDEIRAVKERMDPGWILNPGNMVVR